jgi:tetratricopeptide (TPR) repeat protein
MSPQPQPAKKQRPPLVQATLDRAIALLREGRANSADVLLATIAAEPSARGFVQRLRGQIAYNLGRKDQAWQYLYEAIEAEPSQPDAHGTFGLLLHERRLYPQAIASYANALMLAGAAEIPNLPDWHCGLARALAAVGLVDFALDSLQDALARQPDHADARKGLLVLGAEGTAGEGDPQSADPAGFPTGETPKAADSVLCDALFLEAMRHHAGRDPARAKKVFERVLLLQPDHTNTLCNLGVLERNLGHIDAATVLLERAIALDPKLAPARLALADALAAGGRAEEAIAQYREVLQALPGNDAAHAGLAMTLRVVRDLDGAMAHFHRAVEINQRQPAQFYLALGQTLIARGNLEGAGISLERALQLDPNLDAARRALDETRSAGAAGPSPAREA